MEQQVVRNSLEDLIRHNILPHQIKFQNAWWIFLFVLDYNDNESILDVDLITGRHHQIRVQLSNIKHPLVGDTLYGSSVQKPIKLHTYYLSFSHPTTKKIMEFIEYPIWYKKEKNNDW